VPSQNVFVDRAIDWSARTLVQFNVAVNADIRGDQPDTLADAQSYSVINFGSDVALSAFPLHEIVATLTATINDTSVTVNLDTVLHEVLRLTDYKKNRLPRTCPTMLDKYANYDDAYMGVNSPLGNYLQQPDTCEAPNGAWGQLEFCNANGTPLRSLVGPTAAANNYVASGVTVYFNAAGIPIRTPDAIGAEPAQYPLFVSFFSNERLVLSPFIFADAHEYSTGLFGINNIQLVMNMKSGSSLSRVLRSTVKGGATVSSVALANFSATGSPFQDAKVNVQFLTPSLDLELPAKSIVPFTEFPRYISNNYAELAAGASTTLQSQTIVLPQIPDMLVIYCKPSAYSATEGDYYLPITKISVNFDNFAGLLSSHTTEQLYHIAVHNGLHMDYNAWRGKARGVMAPPGATGANPLVNGNIQTVGGFLVLKPGQDITLQAGQAPSLIGNFTFQAQVTVENTSAAAKTPVLFVMAVNSGFFETLAGRMMYNYTKLYIMPLSVLE
jgi:hypothetical protein